MQRTIDAWKNEVLPGNNGNHANDDFLLADILQRSENDEPNIFRQSLGACLNNTVFRFCSKIFL